MSYNFTSVNFKQEMSKLHCFVLIKLLDKNGVKEINCNFYSIISYKPVMVMMFLMHYGMQFEGA